MFLFKNGFQKVWLHLLTRGSPPYWPGPMGRSQVSPSGKKPEMRSQYLVRRYEAS